MTKHATDGFNTFKGAGAGVVAGIGPVSIVQ